MVNPDAIKSILTICVGGIGNLVMMTPALQSMAQRFPRATVHFVLLKNGSRAVVEQMPRIGEIIETDHSIQGLPGIISHIRRLRPDLAWAATGTNPLNVGMIEILGGARTRLGESFGAGRVLYNVKIPFVKERYEVVSNLAMAAAVGAEAGGYGCRVWSSPDDEGAARDYLTEYGLNRAVLIGMHIGSGPLMDYKRWPESRFIELGRRIVAVPDTRILLFGGAEETALAESVARAIGPAAISVAGQFTIRQTYEIIRRCRLFISNDSGPMHLSAAAGTKVIALFGPTSESRTGPWGEGHSILTAPCKRRPCYDYHPVRCKTRECLTGITVDQVFEKVTHMLPLV